MHLRQTGRDDVSGHNGILFNLEQYIFPVADVVIHCGRCGTDSEI